MRPILFLCALPLVVAACGDSGLPPHRCQPVRESGSLVLPDVCAIEMRGGDPDVPRAAPEAPPKPEPDPAPQPDPEPPPKPEPDPGLPPKPDPKPDPKPHPPQKGCGRETRH